MEALLQIKVYVLLQYQQPSGLHRNRLISSDLSCKPKYH